MEMKIAANVNSALTQGLILSSRMHTGLAAIG